MAPFSMACMCSRVRVSPRKKVSASSGRVAAASTTRVFCPGLRPLLPFPSPVETIVYPRRALNRSFSHAPQVVSPVPVKLKTPRRSLPTSPMSAPAPRQQTRRRYTVPPFLSLCPYPSSLSPAISVFLSSLSPSASLSSEPAQTPFQSSLPRCCSDSPVPDSPFPCVCVMSIEP